MTILAMTCSHAAQPSILVVEDDPTLNDQISQLLERRGYRTHACYSGEDALERAHSESFDLILLDVMLPKLGGFEVLNTLRKRLQTPVIMLTACGAEEDRILGFSCGADDYVPKPFTFTELVLRIEALLRRCMQVARLRPTPNTLAAEPLILRRTDMTVSHSNEPVTLTPLQFRLLWEMVLHQGDTLSKPVLYRTVLERDYSRFDRSLDMHMSRVRRKLIEAGMSADRLQTVHGKGYRFS
ncbi:MULTISPECIES: response regulator transcription factor [Halomonas]|uniref:response regulator transcription factor n=1 Tax=Halomonas TaxID=2745 RepID=UPI001CD4DD53|nr:MULTISPECIES: response regulator transcription factor [Halomonas]MCA0914830.1 response regulator transcription factor [Halomonas denitrificans]